MDWYLCFSFDQQYGTKHIRLLVYRENEIRDGLVDKSQIYIKKDLMEKPPSP